jgi:hypothetical protein
MFGQLKWLGWLPSIVQRQNNWNLTPIDFGRPISRQRVIQENGKTLNLCIIKTRASHDPADHPSKQGVLSISKNGLFCTTST